MSHMLLWCRAHGPSPYLLRGLPDTVTHGLHVALLLFQLLLQLCDPGLEAALLILKSISKGKAAASGASASPDLENPSVKEQWLRVALI